MWMCLQLNILQVHHQLYHLLILVKNMRSLQVLRFSQWYMTILAVFWNVMWFRTFWRNLLVISSLTAHPSVALCNASPTIHPGPSCTFLLSCHLFNTATMVTPSPYNPATQPSLALFMDLEPLTIWLIPPKCWNSVTCIKCQNTNIPWLHIQFGHMGGTKNKFARCIMLLRQTNKFAHHCE
jgi:hypothetical protein